MPMLVAFFLLGKSCFQYLKSISRNHETEVDDILDRKFDYETSHLIQRLPAMTLFVPLTDNNYVCFYYSLNVFKFFVLILLAKG